MIWTNCGYLEAAVLFVTVVLLGTDTGVIGCPYIRPVVSTARAVMNEVLDTFS